MVQSRGLRARLLRGLVPLLFVVSALGLSEREGTPIGAQGATVSRVVGTATAASTASNTAVEVVRDRPNIIMLMADDEAATDMRFMPRVHRLLAEQGVTFTNSFVSYPLCCPSRTTFLTGQYTHNHGVWANLPVREGYQQFTHQDTTLPVALQDAGYHTFQVGKYLNGYGRDNPAAIPPGWNEWHGSIDPTTYRYYGFELNNDGVLHRYAEKPRFYSTDYFTDLATQFIKDQASSSQPFFLNLDYLAPHSGGGPTDVPGVLAPPPGVKERVPCTGKRLRALVLHEEIYPRTQCQDGKTRRPVTDGFAIPPPRYADAFKDQPLPMGLSFNEANIRDKPRFMRTSGDFPRLTPDEVDTLTTMYQQRLASLLGIEDSVERIIQTLADVHELDNTVIIYTSDHGFFLGQHRIPFGKYWPYEEALRVPLIIRGPGLPHGVIRKSPVVNVDLAPTILSLAHARPLRKMDGRSLVPMMRDGSIHWTRDILLEGNTGNAIAYEGIHTARYVYVEYRTGDRELYDLQKDPAELTNRVTWPAYAGIRRNLQVRLDRLRICSGLSCAGITLTR